MEKLRTRDNILTMFRNASSPTRVPSYAAWRTWHATSPTWIPDATEWLPAGLQPSEWAWRNAPICGITSSEYAFLSSKWRYATTHASRISAAGWAEPGKWHGDESPAWCARTSHEWTARWPLEEVILSSFRSGQVQTHKFALMDVCPRAPR